MLCASTRIKSMTLLSPFQSNADDRMSIQLESEHFESKIIIVPPKL